MAERAPVNQPEVEVPPPQPVQAEEVRECYRCGNVGHIARDCEERQHGRRGRAGVNHRRKKVQLEEKEEVFLMRRCPETDVKQVHLEPERPEEVQCLSIEEVRSQLLSYLRLEASFSWRDATAVPSLNRKARYWLAKAGFTNTIVTEELTRQAVTAALVVTPQEATIERKMNEDEFFEQHLQANRIATGQMTEDKPSWAFGLTVVCIGSLVSWFVHYIVTFLLTVLLTHPTQTLLTKVLSGEWKRSGEHLSQLSRSCLSWVIETAGLGPGLEQMPETLRTVEVFGWTVAGEWIVSVGGWVVCLLAGALAVHFVRQLTASPKRRMLGARP